MTTRLTSVVIDAADPGCARDTGGRRRSGGRSRSSRPTRSSSNRPATASRTTSRRSCSCPSTIRRPRRTASTSISPAILLDHQAELVARLVASGAAHVDVGQSDVPWIVLADPDGNEFCVLEPRDRHIGRGPIASIVVDAADPVAIARFWVAASGWPIARRARRRRQPAQSARAAPRPRFRAGRRRQVDEEPRPPRRRPYDGEDHTPRSLGSLRSVREHIDVGQGPDVTWVVLADPEAQRALRPAPAGPPPGDPGETVG